MRVVQEITGLIADLSARVVHDGYRPSASLPEPTRLTWAGIDLDLRQTVVELGVVGIVHLQVTGDPGMLLPLYLGPESPNEAAAIELSDGSIIRSEQAYVSRRRMESRAGNPARSTVELRLRSWVWQPAVANEYVLIGEIAGMANVPGENLTVETTGKSSATHLRLEGSLDWHVLRCAHGCVALAATERLHVATALAALRADLIALDFVCGEEVGLQVLWAVDAEGRVVGGFGTGRWPPATHGRRLPFPLCIDVYECWAASFFRAVAAELIRAENGDASITTPIAGYLDGQRNHIHGGYLLAQVALEGFCRAVLPREARPLLVRSRDEWHEWVRGHEADLLKHAVDDQAAAILLRKLKDNFIERPVGEIVERAFTRWNVPLPSEVLAEISKRNRSAHNFTMYDEASGDAQGAADRLDMVRTLLVAVIALHVGYRGPIAGWEREDDTGHLENPSFWPWTTPDDATARYHCRG